MSTTRASISFKKPTLIGMLAFSAMFLSSLIMYFRLQPVIPLFYSLARESQYLVTKEWIFLFPAFSLMINLIHAGLNRALALDDEIIIKLFVWMTLLMQFLLFIAWLRIILIIS